MQLHRNSGFPKTENSKCRYDEYTILLENLLFWLAPDSATALSWAEPLTAVHTLLGYSQADSCCTRRTSLLLAQSLCASDHHQFTDKLGSVFRQTVELHSFSPTFLHNSQKMQLLSQIIFPMITAHMSFVVRTHRTVPCILPMLSSLFGPPAVQSSWTPFQLPWPFFSSLLWQRLHPPTAQNTSVHLQRSPFPLPFWQPPT